MKITLRNPRQLVPIVSRLLLLCIVFMPLAGCGGGGGGDSDSGTGGILRFVNAVVGSPSLGMEISEADQGAVSYGHSSPPLSLISGNKPLTFYKVNPDGEVESLDVAFDYDLKSDKETLIILYGSLDDLKHLIVETDGFDFDEEFGRAGFVNLADNAPHLDMYLTAEDVGLFESGPIANSEYGVFSGMEDVDEGEYEIQFTAIGEKELVYDAGLVEIDEDTNYFYVVLDFAANDDSKLLAIEITGSNASRELVDGDIPSQLRFVNGIADYPSVDVYLGSTSSEPLFSNIPFGVATDYLELEADVQSFNVTAHGVKDTFLFEESLELLPGKIASLVTAGLVQDENVSGTLVYDNVQNITDGVSISFIHASSSNANVDVYLLVPGQPVFDATPLVSNLSFLLSYDRELPAGDYELAVIQSDNEATVLGPTPVTLNHGEVIDMYLMDSEGGGTPGQLELYAF